MNQGFVFRQEYATPELWGIISSFCTRRTLQNICLVGNRNMVDPAQRHLFKDLTFKVSSIHTANVLLEELASSHLVGYVYNCTIPFWPAAGPDLGSLLPRFSRVKALRLGRLNLTASVLASLGQLTNLKNLEFDNVRFRCPLNLSAPLQLEKFNMILDIGREPHDDVLVVEDEIAKSTIPGSFFSPGVLESVMVSHDEDDRPVSFVYETLIAHQPHNNLSKLDVVISTYEGIVRLLKLIDTSPLLQTLRIVLESMYDIEDELASIEMDSNSILLLRDVTVPPVLAPIICPGRPISRFSMEHSDNDDSSWSYDIVATAIESLNGAILTELVFEKTLAEDASELLSLTKQYLPKLQVLRMVVKDIESVDEPSGEGCDCTFYDDISVKDPDDIAWAQQQFLACFDPSLLNLHLGSSLIIPPDSYLMVLSMLSRGEVELPESLKELYLIQKRTCKRHRYTTTHELKFIRQSAKNDELKNLTTLRVGVDNVYNQPWKRNSSGLWAKQGWFYKEREKNFVGTLVMAPDGMNDYAPTMFNKTEIAP